MNRYVPISSISFAKELSKILYQLSRPLSINTNDVTQIVSGYVVHPVTSEVFLEIPDATLPLNLAATVNILDPLFSHAIYLGESTEDERSATKVSIQSHLGQPVNIMDFLPQYLRIKAKTKEELDSLGFFASSTSI